MDRPYYGVLMGLPLTTMTGIFGATPTLPLEGALGATPISPGDPNNKMTPPKSSWEFYNKKTWPKDTAFVTGVNESMNILLVFAGLFSATATVFLTFTLPLLQPSNGDMTNQSLVTIIAKMGNSSYQAPDIPNFTVPSSLLIANCLVSASVAGNLLAAFCAILITQWTKNFTNGLQGIKNEQYRARMRHFRFQGAEEWHLFGMSEAVPTLLHVSLVLFAGGATLFLSTVNHTVAIVTAIILGASACSYLVLSIAPLWSKAAPFRSPLTALLEYCVVKVPILVFHSIVGLRNSLRSLVKGSQTPKEPVDAQVDILGREKPLYRFVHKKWDLDVSVLVHLMQSADRHSERNVLETCLVDFQTLFKVEEESPELFDHNEILSTYFFLGKCSLQWEDGASSLFYSQRDRGLNLCTFLAWFLELSERWPKERQNALKLRLPLVEDTHIPHAIREYGKINRQLEFLIVGYLAGNALQHLHGGQNPRCCCFDETPERDVYAKLIACYNPDLGTGLSIGNLVIRYISCQTRCLAVRLESWDQPLPLWIDRIAHLATLFRLYDAQFQSTWESFLVQYERRTDLRPLVVSWIAAIREVVRGRLPMYTAATLPGMDLDLGVPQEYNEKEDNPAIDKWINGTTYGPVLDTISASVVVHKLQINPILCHRSPQGERGGQWDIIHYLGKWPALDTPFNQSRIRTSATLPRMKSLTLHSNHLSRPIVIFGTGSGGTVTCGDVFVGMTEFFREELPDNVYNRIICRNRLGTDSPPSKDHIVFTNGDLLGNYTLFDGLDGDEDFVRGALGLDTASGVPNEGLENDGHVITKKRQCIGHLVLKLEHRNAVNVRFSDEDGNDANSVQPPAEWGDSDSSQMKYGEGTLLPYQARHQSYLPPVRRELPSGIGPYSTANVITPGIYAKAFGKSKNAMDHRFLLNMWTYPRVVGEAARQVQKGLEGNLEEDCPLRNPHDNNASRVLNAETSGGWDRDSGRVFSIPLRANKREVAFALASTTMKNQDDPKGDPEDESTTPSKNTPRNEEVPLPQGGSMMPRPRKLSRHGSTCVPKKASSYEDTPISRPKSTRMMNNGCTPYPEGHSLFWHGQSLPRSPKSSQAREAMEDDLDSPISPLVTCEQNQTIDLLDEKAKLWKPKSGILPKGKYSNIYSQDEVDSGQSLPPLDPSSDGEVSFSVGGGMGNRTVMNELADTSLSITGRGQPMLPRNQTPPPESTRSSIMPVAVGPNPAGRFNILDVTPPGTGRSMAQPLPSRTQIILAGTLRPEAPGPEVDEELIILSGGSAD